MHSLQLQEQCMPWHRWLLAQGDNACHGPGRAPVAQCMPRHNACQVQGTMHAALNAQCTTSARHNARQLGLKVHCMPSLEHLRPRSCVRHSNSSAQPLPTAAYFCCCCLLLLLQSHSNVVLEHYILLPIPGLHLGHLQASRQQPHTCVSNILSHT